MKVSIIITSYNKAEFIEEAINSALGQDYFDLEVLIIDDGSSDSSREIIEKFRDFEKVSIVLQDNIGVIKTRNKAIRMAQGELIVQLDADDILADCFVFNAVKKFEKDGIKLVYGSTNFIGAKQGKWDLGSYSIEKQLITNQIPISAMFRKKDFEKTDGYDLAFSKGHEDWDFWLSLIELGGEVIQLTDNMLFYRIIKDSRNHIISDETMSEIRNEIFWKHISIYRKYKFNSPINLEWKVKKLESYVEAYNSILNSKDYKLGKLIFSPIRLILKAFKKT